jgi:hypothetical protein
MGAGGYIYISKDGSVRESSSEVSVKAAGIALRVVVSIADENPFHIALQSLVGRLGWLAPAAPEIQGTYLRLF